MKLAYVISLSLMLLAPVCVRATTLSPDQKAADLRQVAELVKSAYGPYTLKQQTLHIDVDKLLARYTERAAALKTNLEYYYLLNQFVAEFQDSHFSSRVQSSHVSYLGFATDRVRGKVLIDDVDRSVLPKEIFPFTAGDEVVTFDGKPAAEVVQALASYIGSGYQETRLRTATMYLTYRATTSVPPRYGTVAIQLRHRDDDAVETVTLPWKQKGGLVEEGSGWGRGPTKADYMTLSVEDVYDSVPRIERSYLCSPQTRITPPEGTKVLMAEPFVAYYYPTPKGNVGYLRIPHYSWPAAVAETRLKQYEWAIYQLEKNTVGLIIDQDHNCGGQVDFLEHLVQMFAARPFTGIQFQFLATRGEYFTFKEFANAEEDHTLAGMDMDAILDAVKTAWNHGDRMTSRISFQGNRELMPASIRYSKPIIILTDEMSGSGGDAFPALMQGIGRAKTLGTRTMGAGGHVVDVGALDYSGNTLRLTKSLFFHPNGRPIENNGVTPDYAYTPTEYDFLNGYECYRKFYTEKLLALVDPTADVARATAALGASNALGAVALAADTKVQACP